MSSRATLSPIETLAEQAFGHAKELSDYLCANGHSHPSFDRDAPATTLPPAAPRNVLEAREKLTEAAFKLFQLATGPSELLPNMAASYQTLFAFRWLCYFKIFASVPLEGSVPYATVANATQVSESQLKSIARMVMTWNILCEPIPNHVAHTATSALLLTKPNLFDWAVFMCETSMPTAAKMVEASIKWPDSTEKNETAYNVAFNTDLPFFTHLSQNPGRTKQFSGYMKSVTDSEGTDLKHLINGFDWASLPSGSTVVDVGGSTGHGTFALAETFPDLRFIVQDLPEVTANGVALLRSQPDSISSRVSFQPHNFFEPQPVRGATVYLLRMILHDWPTKEAVSILIHVSRALTHDSTLLIMDTVLPAPGQIPACKERLLRVRDLTMMQVFNGRERSLDDWKAILRLADSRLRLCEVKQPFGSNMSLLTVKPDTVDEVNRVQDV